MLELELKPPELELELIFWRFARFGVGIGVETSGVGVGLELIFWSLAGVGIGVGVETSGVGVGVGVELILWS